MKTWHMLYLPLLACGLYDHTRDESLLADRLLPTAHEVLTFFDEHYSTDDRGRLVMHPAQAVETWWDCPNYDWIPDQDHGGVLMKALQAMLLQPDPYSEKIHLLPAWPQDWDVKFKLHAPDRTTVECEYRGGKIERLEVTPTSRRQDIIIREASN